VETPSGSQAGPLTASRKLARRIACEPQNRKTHDCEALPTPRLADLGRIAELPGKRFVNGKNQGNYGTVY
jgi:hypothetical protein